MIRLAVITFASAVLTGCMAAQQMHFAELSPVDFRVPDITKAFDPKSKYEIRNVSNSGYENFGEFSNYSWHGFVDGRYEGFKKLPYQDPDVAVKSWLSEVIQENGVAFSDNPDYFLDVHVEKLKLKTQKDSRYDYRACMVTLKVDFVTARGGKKKQIVLDGISKLNGSDMVISNTSPRAINVSFYPDTPQICKLAIASALRNIKI